MARYRPAGEVRASKGASSESRRSPRRIWRRASPGEGVPATSQVGSGRSLSARLDLDSAGRYQPLLLVGPRPFPAAEGDLGADTTAAVAAVPRSSWAAPSSFV